MTPESLARQDWIRTLSRGIVRVQRPQERSNGAGGHRETLRDVPGMESVPCRVLPPRRAWSASEGRQVTIGEARIALCQLETAAADLDVKPGDVLSVGANRFRIVGPDGGRADAIALICDVERQSGQPG